MALTIPTSDPDGYSVAEFDTTTLLSHAARQARQRKYQDYLIVDTDSHHYENESFKEIAQFIEDPVLRQTALASGSRRSAAGFLGGSVGNQDMGGRVTRYHLRAIEKTPKDEQRDAALTKRWMDSCGIDVAFLFPTPMLLLSTHPQIQTQIDYMRAYNRWLCEVVLPREPRLRTMLCLPFGDPEASYAMVQEFGDFKGVVGWLVPALHNVPVHDNRFMKLYADLEERGQPISFHGAQNWSDRAFASMNRFLGVHALGFVFYNMVHLTNWIVNGLPERFPKLKVCWMESGLAWVPFMMQRLDNEYMMRSNECPSLKMKPSDYMRQMFWCAQPMEVPDDLSVLQTTFKLINAETQLMYASDYPHWDFDLPSVIFDLPFLSDQAKRNILGETANKLFNLQIKGKLAQIPGA
jgi:predicted TIM-barrel fold metal-dependent hydrolase